MFFDDFNGPKRVKTGFFSDFTQGVICAVLAVVCFILYKREWMFGLIFVACAAIRLWHHFKTKRDNAPLKKTGSDEDYYDLYDEYDALTDVDHDDGKEEKPLTRKERKARYKERLAEIEREYAELDYDEDDDSL